MNLGNLCAFDEQTTNKNDFRAPPDNYQKTYRWPNDRVESNPQVQPAPQKYVCFETLTALRPTEYIPSNLLWGSKPIINPPGDYCNVQKTNEDSRKEEVIRSRPRVYMGSAISMDDIDEPEVREIFVNHMYVTDFKRSMKETLDYVQSKKSIKSTAASRAATVVDPPCPIKEEWCQIEIPKPVPPLDGKLRKNYMEWDRKELRGSVDPTLNFWRRRYNRREYEEKREHDSNYVHSIVPEKTIATIKRLVDTDRLRAPYDIAMQGYDGFMPDCAVIGLEKIDLPYTHPMHTTNDTVYINHFAKGMTTESDY